MVCFHWKHLISSCKVLDFSPTSIVGQVVPPIMAGFYFSVILENILNVSRTVIILQYLLVSPSLLLFPGRDVFFYIQLHVRKRKLLSLNTVYLNILQFSNLYFKMCHLSMWRCLLQPWCGLLPFRQTWSSQKAGHVEAVSSKTHFPKHTSLIGWKLAELTARKLILLFDIGRQNLLFMSLFPLAVIPIKISADLTLWITHTERLQPLCWVSPPWEHCC